ncbi:MAG: hypothetical protein G3W63_19475 [Xanthomonas euvesicatoria]|uniref:Uncharacterized protein n=1 Tax=Xanthomonas euvesicatoria TaxID=456327 RepID=A0A6B3KQL1_XANEU|nr:hypothetical protein [Xanthomonas euvesicatoria]NEK91674.1 hypothetical protein [Xanthomonas euvesicatoria]NEL31716.1 hypothetical protein [Xanthomonas euvesicatoria]UUW40426.1 hypothetical protein [Xanthomonas phage BsXeu269p/3]
MSIYQIPETPNTANEPLMTVAQAVTALRQHRPDLPDLDIGTLNRLGRDCSLYARVKHRPTGVVEVVGKPWPTEKSYTFDTLREAFRLHPATRDYVPQEVHS